MGDACLEALRSTLNGTYTIERELGGGGMSRVFLAEELRLRRRVVIKVLSPDVAEGVSQTRFAREILTVASLQHANIVPVLSTGECDGVPFYTMPFVEGESVRERLAHGPIPVAEVVAIIRDVARALAYAHGHGIVHRDIKPDNILLSSGVALVTDFGIAKALAAARVEDGSARVTQTGTVVGTPAYMAPEQVVGDPSADHRTDIYALGAMAYEMLSGALLFSARSPVQMAAAQLSSDPRPITALRDDVPQPLADLVMRCVAKLPDDRPQSAEDVAASLDALAAAGGVGVVEQFIRGQSGKLRMALLIYAAAFVLVTVLARIATVRIGLPDWVFPGSLAVMALGFPLVVWTGFVHHVTRHHIAATSANRPLGPVATIAIWAAPLTTWRRTTLALASVVTVFCLGVAAYMTMRAYGIGPGATLLSTGQLKAKNQIVMTDFSGAAGDSAVVHAVSFAVRSALSQSNALNILDQGSVADALGRMQRPRSAHVDLALAQGIALREGATAIIDGVLTPLGTGYLLSVRLVTADSLHDLATAQASCSDPDGLISAADKVARALRDKAGESLRTVQGSQPLTLARTASLEALRLYGEGSRANNVERDYPKAVERLRLAVAADSMFAEAWRLLGTAMSNLGRPRSQVDSALTRAYQLRERLPEGERDFVVGSYFGRGPGRDRALAAEAYQRTIASGALRNNLAVILTYRREYARAESLYRADILQRPVFQLAYEGLVLMLGYQGKFLAADSALAVYRKKFPRSPTPARLAIYLAFARGDFESGQRLTDSARLVRDPAEPASALWWSARLALLHGQLSKWRTYRASALVSDAAVGRRGASPYSAAEALALATIVGGDRTAEARAFDAALSRSPLSTMPDAERQDLEVAFFLASAGEAARASALVNNFLTSVRDSALKRDLEPILHTALGMIALSERRPQEAMREFRRGDLRPDGPANACNVCLPLYLGRSFDAANLPDSAIAQYELYLKTPSMFRTQERLDPVNLPAIHERLGQLYEAKDDAMNATKHYRAFIDLWKNADPELQPRVAEARRRVAKLTEVERPRR